MAILSSTLDFVLFHYLFFPYLKASADGFLSLCSYFFDFQNLMLSYTQFQQKESEKKHGAKPCTAVGLYILYCSQEALVHAFDGLCPKGWMSALTSAFTHTFCRSLTCDPFLRLT